MKKPAKLFNTLLFNEWKESPTYKIDKWFMDRKLQFEKWFETELPDFEYDYFEWADSNSVVDIYTGVLFFSEPDIEYRLNIILDADKVEQDDIKEFNIQLTGYRKEDSELLGTLDKTATLDQLVSNLLIELVNEFKLEKLDDEGKKKVSNDLEGPESNMKTDLADDLTGGEENPEEPTGEIQEPEEDTAQ